MRVPEDLLYSSDHEWVRVGDGVVRIGITDYAQDALGDVVFVQVPDQGATVAAGQNLVGSVTQNGHREIGVILGSQDRYS
ncbi:MAG TPA: hypothetical protein PLV68_20915, partial [Ilumatobacteraceae bacterium]|nr:hypothetical protein [Ilumatobacteraceae bacterium]